MAAIETVTAPLVVIAPDGKKSITTACFPHRYGLLYLDLYWHRSSPAEAAHLIRGELSGEGPWRIGNYVIRLLGCQGTDPELQQSWQEFQQHLETGTDYPPPAQIEQIARRLGAIID